MTFIFSITGETYKLFMAYRSNARFHVKIHDMDWAYTKQRSIDTMTPNKLAVYFVADMVLADMIVADIDFPCGRYGFLLWPISSCCGRYGCGRYGLWPIWSHPQKLNIETRPCQSYNISEERQLKSKDHTRQQAIFVLSCDKQMYCAVFSEICSRN